MSELDIEARRLQGREPSFGYWVSLSEALTFIAFGSAHRCQELATAIWGASDDGDWIDPPANGLGEFIDRESGLRRLEEALAKLKDGVDRAVVEIRGRFAPGYLPIERPLGYSIRAVYESTPRAISAEDIDHYGQFQVERQFDLTTESYLYSSALLFRPLGHPAIMWSGHPMIEERDWLLATGADGYLFVEVSRDDVLALAGYRPCSPAKPVAQVEQPAETKRPVSSDTLRSWFSCRVKAYEGSRPPRWQECLDAAKAAFPDNKITKDHLLEIRRDVATGWRPGRR